MGYMPPGFAEWDKQKLWDFFTAKQSSVLWDNHTRNQYWLELTGLGPYSISYPSMRTTVDLQAKRIKGLTTQMAQMNKGYTRKIKRLEAKILELQEKLNIDL